MQAFKQWMAFPLFATVAFLLWVLSGQVDEYGLLRILLALTLIAMAVWIYGRWGVAFQPQGVRRWSKVAAIALLIMAAFWGYPRAEAQRWQTWSPEKVAALQAQGQPMFVDFTARWCATCQTNKAVVFTSNEVLKAIDDKGIVLLKADWTKRDPVITQVLASYARSAVPFNLLYVPGEEEPQILPSVLTPGIVLKAFEAIQ